MNANPGAVQSRTPPPETGTIRRHVVWSMTERVAGVLVGACIAALLTRILTRDEFGIFSFAFAAVTIVSGVSTLSPDLMIQQMTIRRTNRRSVYSAAGAIVAALAGGSVVLLAVFSTFQSSDRAFLIALMGISLAARPFVLIEAELQSDRRGMALGGCRLAGRSTTLICLGVAGILELGMKAAAVSVVVGQLVHGASLLAFRRDSEPATSEETQQTLEKRALLSKAGPLMIAALGTGVIMRIDVVMLGLLSTDAETGLYSVAAQISELTYAIPLLLGAIAGSTMATYRTTDLAQYRQSMQNLLGLLTLSGILSMLGLLVVAPTAIPLIFGSSYANAADILRIHALSLLFVFPGVGVTIWIVNEGLERVAMVGTLAAAAINVSMNWVLIPTHGGIGAAWATVASYWFAAMGIHLFSGQTRSLFGMMSRSFLPTAWVPAAKSGIRLIQK